MFSLDPKEMIWGCYTNWKWNMGVFPVCVVPLGHASPILFYGNGAYDPPFSKYCSKRRKLRLPDKSNVVSRSFPLHTDSSNHTGSWLYYDFGSYDQPFPRYSAKKTNYAKVMANLSQNHGNPISIK